MDYAAVKAPDLLTELKRSIEKLKIMAAEQQIVELTEEAKGGYCRERDRGVRDRRKYRLELHQWKEENIRLRRERDQARQPINGQHAGPTGCPTWYDGCNCNVETLVHNIDRAEKAEATVQRLTKQLKELP